MGRPRKWENDAEKQRAYRAKRKEEGNPVPSGTKQPRPDREFVAIDGEDIDGHYCLIAAGNGARFETTGRSMTPWEFLQFLLDAHRRSPKAHLIGFASNYDIERGFLMGLSDRQKKGVVETGDKDANDPSTWYRLRHGLWNVAVHYRPKMHLKVCFWSVPDGGATCRVTLTNVFCLFQRAFTAVLEKEWPGVATEDELEIIREWKGRRGDFVEANRAEIAAYNDLENVLLARLMGVVRDSVRAAGVPMPTSWHGPGALVKAAYRQRGVSNYLPQERDGRVLDACLRAYFGGRFQCLQIGVFDRFYDYDLISAYPAAIWRLPSETGTWEWIEGEAAAEGSPWTVCRVDWKIPGDSFFGPFPFRTEKGEMRYPNEGKGWYWQWEAAAAKRIYGDRIRVLGGHRLTPDTENAWEWIREQAEYRAEIKRTKPGEAQVLKLINNSAYGVLIQSVGKARYQSAMLAGLITSWTRAQLLDAAALDPEAIIGFATDGVFSSRPLPVSLGKGLGDWEDASGDGGPADVWANGVYCFRNPDGTIIGTPKARGIPRGVVDWDDLRRRWVEGERPLRQTYSFRAPISTRLAVAQGHPELAGQWAERTRTLSTLPSGWVLYYGNPMTAVGDPKELTTRARAYGTVPGEVSHPYSRGLWADLLEDIEIGEEEMILDEERHWMFGK